MAFDYDIHKELKKNEMRAEKILNDFPNIDGLSTILNQTLNIVNSENLGFLSNNLNSLVEKFSNNQDNINRLNENSFHIEFPQLDYAQILQKVNIFYIPQIWGDTITFDHYNALNNYIIGLLSIKKDQKEITIDTIINISNKIMILLDNFDKNENFIPPNQDFFEKLKKLKWDKNVNKFFGKIFDIEDNMTELLLKNLPGASYLKFSTNSRFTLVFLTACSAISNDSLKMNFEDVITAYKTYYKLSNVDLII